MIAALAYQESGIDQSQRFSVKASLSDKCNYFAFNWLIWQNRFNQIAFDSPETIAFARLSKPHAGYGRTRPLASTQQ
jgi:hypothetical protein